MDGNLAMQRYWELHPDNPEFKDKLVDRNTMIAEFMGVREQETTYDNYGTSSPIWFTANELFRTRTFSTRGKSFKAFCSLSQYHTSWDWLMPVVEKISRHVYDEQEENDGLGGKRVIKYTACPRTFGMLSPEGKIMVRFNQSTLFEADTLIEATYQAVLDWIQWYNVQSKTSDTNGDNQ